MTSHTPIALGNGKFCYSGPDCKRHGKKTGIFRSIQDVFSRAEKQFPSKINLTPSFTQLDFSILIKEHVANLSSDEQWAFHSYADRSGSIRMNRTLDAGSPLSPELSELVKNLDSGIAKYKNSSEQELFRGSGHTPEGWENLSAGDVIEMKSFTSTSAAPTKAMEFAKDNAQPLLLRITTSKGAPVRTEDDEYEFLLPRGEKYEVVSFVKNSEVTAGFPSYSDQFPTKTSHVYKGVDVLTLHAL